MNAKQRWGLGLGAALGGAAALAVVRGVSARRERTRRLATAPADRGRRIVILGAGFAGLNLADRLVRVVPPDSGWTITLVDRHNYFLFTPLLYHAATGLVDPSAILFPVRRVSRQPHFRFREAAVQEIDLDGQVVHLDDGELDYDYLVLALGSITNFFGRGEEVRQALPIKTAGDAVLVRNRIMDAYERADITDDPEERERCLTFVVVGGGATGVELAGAVLGLIRGTLAQQYPGIHPEETRVLLFEATGGILPGLDPELARYALRRLNELGVEVRLETPVRRVDEAGLLAENGEFVPTRTVVWAAGVRPSPVTSALNVPKFRDGRILVNSYLQVEGVPACSAIGDNAAFLDPSTGRPLPPNAAVAVRQGRALAEILVARIEGRQPRPFVYRHLGELVSLGRHEAVAEVRGIRFTGLPAWLLWRAFYLSRLMGFKNQVAVVLDWAFAYLYQRDTVRMEVPAAPPGAVASE